MLQKRLEAHRGVRMELNELEVAYDEFVALSISKASFSGRLIAIVGHNGSGKSTLIKSCLGLLPIKHGTLKISSFDGITLLPERDMAFSPETGAVFADISVEQYIKLWCRLKHRDPNYYLGAGRKYIEQLEIEPLLKKLGRELSKGQRRRVQSAIGFITDPKLFFFDEPFDGLDVQQSGFLADLLLKESADRSIVISSHRMEVVERVADHVVVLSGGKIAASGTSAEVCRLIGGETIFVRNGSAAPQHLREIVQLLQSSFSDWVITQSGEGVAVTGHGVNSDVVVGFLNRQGLHGVNANAISGSLVDAMSLHLRSIAKPSGSATGS